MVGCFFTLTRICCPCRPRRVTGSKPSWVKELAQALLRVEDVNVLVVDWIYRASFVYNRVVHRYKEVSVQVSILINQLQVLFRIYYFCSDIHGKIFGDSKLKCACVHQGQGCKLESFHFIGVSLGAHVAGFVGTLFMGKIGRITGGSEFLYTDDAPMAALEGPEGKSRHGNSPEDKSTCYPEYKMKL